MEVVLTTGRIFFFCGITGLVIDSVIEFNTHNTRKYR